MTTFPTDDEREAVVDALVMSPMADYLGTSLEPVSRAATDILNALAPLIRAREAAAWKRGFDRGYDRGRNPDLGFTPNPYARQEADND